MTPAQLAELEAFEGGYGLYPIAITLVDSQETTTALTFIRKGADFIERPSEAYLTAIFCHLREVGAPSTTIEIAGYTATGERVLVDEGWSYPEAHSMAGLPAFLVIANSERVARGLPSWAMPAAIRTYVALLAAAHVHTVNDLSVALHNIAKFNGSVVAAGYDKLDDDTTAVFSQLLFPPCPTSAAPSSTVEAFQSPTVKMFVYGSLLSGLHNVIMLNIKPVILIFNCNFELTSSDSLSVLEQYSVQMLLLATNFIFAAERQAFLFLTLPKRRSSFPIIAKPESSARFMTCRWSI